MSQQTMYPASINTPVTNIVGGIDNIVTSITVADGTTLPPAPNIVTLGFGATAETILYTSLAGNVLSGITRGFQGVAQSWVSGTAIARYYTAYDHNAFINNINDMKNFAIAMAITL